MSLADQLSGLSLRPRAHEGRVGWRARGVFGAFHALVSGVLILYGIALEDGILYATVLHTSQVIGVIFFGGLSLLITMFLKKNNFKIQDSSEKSE